MKNRFDINRALPDTRNVERSLTTCINGHRVSVPVDAVHSWNASTYCCPVCRVGVKPDVSSIEGA